MIKMEKYYDSGDFSDITIISKESIPKKLHKIILGIHSKLLAKLIENENEIHLEFEWKYLEPIIKMMYYDEFHYYYPNLFDDNINKTIHDFEQLLHIAIHLNMDDSTIKIIIEHFNYKNRLKKCNMRNLCELLYSINRIYHCENISNYKNILTFLCDKIVIQDLMSIDKYFDVYGEDFDNTISSDIYNNIKCIWFLDDIISVTTEEFIMYNLEKLLTSNIDLQCLYLLAYDNNETIDNKEICSSLEKKDISICNTIIIDSLIKKCLLQPSYLYLPLYKLITSNKNKSIKLIDKLVELRETELQLKNNIDELHKKVICQVCCYNELEVTIKGCGHLFCYNCLEEMMNQNRSNNNSYTKCPMCKKEFYRHDLINIYI